MKWIIINIPVLNRNIDLSYTKGNNRWKRLTQTTEIGNAYYPKCFEKPCSGMGECLDDNCDLIYEACKKLAEEVGGDGT